MAFTGNTKLTSGIKQKNNLTFPLVHAEDVYIKDDTSLPRKYQSLQDKLSDIDQDIIDVDTRITNAIDDLDNPDEAVTNQFVTVVSEENGLVSVTRARPTIDNVDGLTDVVNDYNNRLNNLELNNTEITDFHADQEFAELGSTVSVKLSWTVYVPGDKPLHSQNINGTNIPANNRNRTMSNISSDTTWTLNVYPIEGVYKSAETSIKFINRIYYGASAIPSTYNSDFIKGLSNSYLSETGSNKISVNVTGNNYIFIAIPESYGIPNIKFNDWRVAFDIIPHIQYTNGTVNTYYNIYKSPSYGGGNIELTIE